MALAVAERAHPEPVLLAGWGRVPRSVALVRHTPSVDEVCAALGAGHARGVLPRGLGRSYGDAALNAGGIVLDTTALDDVRRFDPAEGLVTAGAGISLGDLMHATIPHGWFVPVTPGTRWVTLGGAIAADIHGKNHHRDGSIGAHILDLQLATPDGELRTLTRADTPELLDATIGGMGLTGVITQATIKLQPIATARMRVEVRRARDLDDTMATLAAGDEDARYSVAWLDAVAGGRAVVMRGDHAALDELPARAARDPLRFATHSVPGPPAWMPGGLIRRSTMRLANEAWFRRAPAEPTQRLMSIPGFFHPLDAIPDWNRLYGPRGFLQYQFVVPFEAAATVASIVGDVARRRLPAPLSVLKRFGAGNPMLSFPMPGWTLAIDLPAGIDGLGRILDGWDERVAEAGGRIYLAKDGRARPEVIRAMYAGLGAWRAVRATVDPHGTMRSDLARRLELI